MLVQREKQVDPNIIYGAGRICGQMARNEEKLQKNAEKSTQVFD